ncbi:MULTISPECIES: mechanosensitive ion channel family protein [unclassified Pantoea]|jgi:Small-conductance mechanosensitive channel|uniref:mechanosensitive ion channel family protein n=1 Tax=unclassified Pantoea TaxID=2630326 RepID=UPI00073EF293|nr:MULTISPECIES: mechanosensitive ion channel family protein [unclassified Pantoea]MCA1175268.1 mechanosensitive ion channel family protein [Pantoea sp. alder69]MCA1250230.1 mechanosensitive ion channel family protein [Pantoea sp. alder70]MCA1263815.1 mechanosensitive ion channel family protein [Pantoea sp. alder81]MDI6958705.1 mechanosensitive ion channel family protein [Pantoea sp. Pa-EAmG]SNY74977.1 Small-conductance mechanosensitive channel [Pantoea sp. GL120224-02]
MENWLSAHRLQLIFLNQTFWINSAIIVFGTLMMYWLLRTLIRFVSNRIAHYSEQRNHRVTTLLVEILRSTSQPLLLIFSLLIALRFVDLPASWSVTIAHGWFLAFILQMTMWIDCGIRLWLQSLLRDPLHVRNPVTTVILGILLRVVVWVMMMLAILSNMGINITALVASLGVGGIAIALAIQTVLSDVFASLAIGFDKPFEHGDFIVFGDVAGSIEHIGLKTTRLRSLSGEQIVCSNTILLQQTIHNYKRMQQRRIVFKFGINYGTPAEKVRQIGSMVKEIIQDVPDTRFDRAHFLAFDESQLTFEVVYFVLSAEYNKYMDIQQEINLQLMAQLEQKQIRFAFPMRRVEFTGGVLPRINLSDASNESSPQTAQR